MSGSTLGAVTNLQQDDSHAATSALSELFNESQESRVDIQQLQSAVSHFNRLSKNFVSSYQTLEGEVENLADKLAAEVANKEIQLKEKERLAQRLQSLLSILPAGVIVLDGKGMVQDCNAVAVKFLGRPLIDEPWINIIKRSFAPRNDDGCEISLKDGRRVKIETRSLEHETGQLIVMTDLTETRRMQDKLSHDKRLASMGKMMGFLAHQIRTPLSSALLYAANLTDIKLGADTQQRFGEKLLDCLQHMELHINDMLQFVRSGGLKKKNVGVGKFIKDLEIHLVSNLYHWPINTKVNSEFRLDLNLDVVLSAITNLVENSIQATYQLAEPEIEIVIEEQENHCLVTVIDNGCGIPPENIEKISEPFYTTKPGGTGLGLAVVQGVMRTHLGELDIKSNEESGTRITMVFPKVTNDESTILNSGNIEPSRSAFKSVEESVDDER